MSTNRYAPLPNPRNDNDAHKELDAAFDDSDDDEDSVQESRPLTSSTPHSPPRTPAPGTYDFENVDYASFPPPGSPPAPSAFALPNAFGNSNGLIPSTSDETVSFQPKTTWFQRAASAVLPSQLVQRWGIDRQRVPTGAVGGGTANDGVFANVTAKPTRPVVIHEGDDTYVLPEDTRPEAPPSYAAASADAVPPYWETTVHAPFSPDGIGEMIIDSLPTGSLFSFLWNMLVSVSFQFVGFLLTYLLHTTHAARLGSRAGLGVTLIQYGFTLRNRESTFNSDNNETNYWQSMSYNNTEDSTSPWGYHHHHHGTEPVDNSTMPTPTRPALTEEQATMLVADATTEWLSFFLMTVGWFILLTSLLGFWRVKRWERGIMASQQANAPNTANPTSAAAASNGDSPAMSQFERMFGQRFAHADFLRQGFGFGSGHTPREPDDQGFAEAEEGRVHRINMSEDADENDILVVRVDDDEEMTPERERRIRELMNNERQLHQDLRAAGLL